MAGREGGGGEGETVDGREGGEVRLVEEREEGDHNEGMRVCRAVKRCLLDSQRHARWVNGRRGTEMDAQPEGGCSYVCMYLRGAMELRQTVYTVYMGWALTKGKTNSGRERGECDVAVATNRRGHDRQHL